MRSGTLVRPDRYVADASRLEHLETRLCSALSGNREALQCDELPGHRAGGSFGVYQDMQKSVAVHFSVNTGAVMFERVMSGSIGREVELPEEWIAGEVVMMSSWAVYVKARRVFANSGRVCAGSRRLVQVVSPLGEAFVGILEKEDFEGSFCQACRLRLVAVDANAQSHGYQEAARGSQVRVRIKEVPWRLLT